MLSSPDFIKKNHALWIEIERSLIRSLLTAPEALSKISNFLQPSDFFEPQSALFYKVLLEVYEATNTFDWSVVSARCSELSQGREPFPTPDSVTNYAIELIRWSIGGDIEWLARRVKCYSLIRETRKRFLGIETSDPETWLNEAKELNDYLISEMEKTDNHSISIQEAINGDGAPKISEVPFRDLASIIDGFRRGLVYVIAGAPRVGKTSLALNLASIFVQEKMNTLFVSTEVDASALAEMLVGIRARVDISKRKRGFLSKEEETKFLLARDELKEAPLSFCSKERIEDILRVAEKLHAQKPLDFVFVDYIQNLKTNRRHETRAQEVAEISRELKNAATRLKCAVILISQLSRDAEKQQRRLRLSDLKESGDIENDADVAILLWRKALYEKKPSSTGVIECHIAKNRWGVEGRVKLFYDLSIRFFSDLAEGYLDEGAIEEDKEELAF